MNNPTICTPSGVLPLNNPNYFTVTHASPNSHVPTLYKSDPTKLNQLTVNKVSDDQLPRIFLIYLTQHSILT